MVQIELPGCRCFLKINREKLFPGEKFSLTVSMQWLLPFGCGLSAACPGILFFAGAMFSDGGCCEGKPPELELTAPKHGCYQVGPQFNNR